jgi:hypothetical protein
MRHPVTSSGDPVSVSSRTMLEAANDSTNPDVGWILLAMNSAKNS